MATTNWAEADVFQNRYPRTFRILQDLVLAMEKCAKDYGKKSLFGKDKGVAALQKFGVALTETLQAMVEDNIVSRTDSPSVIRLQLIKMIERFAQVFPNWHVSYAFANEFFVNRADVAEDIIKQKSIYL